MKKTYSIEVDCANCANLIEEEANKFPGIQTATVNFMTQKMKVEFTEDVDPQKTIQEFAKKARIIEEDFDIKY